MHGATHMLNYTETKRLTEAALVQMALSMVVVSMIFDNAVMPTIHAIINVKSVGDISRLEITTTVIGVITLGECVSSFFFYTFIS